VAVSEGQDTADVMVSMWVTTSRSMVRCRHVAATTGPTVSVNSGSAVVEKRSAPNSVRLETHSNPKRGRRLCWVFGIGGGLIASGSAC
jgi:hypothetical protein